MPDAFADAYYGVARPKLLTLLGSRVPTRVLEIGCGEGANLVDLKRRFPASRATGVELVSAVAQAARAKPDIDEVIEADVADDRQRMFEPGSFDLIVLSHVLEHLAQPERLLHRCHDWLQPSGCMLVALPNVRHASVLIDLVLRGDFRYQPAGGILDSTHLRFYTRRSARRLLEEQAGWRVVAEQADIEGSRSRTLEVATFGMAREFAAYAYNFLVIKA